MSKSAGNFFTVKDIAEKYPLSVLRFFMLSAHYRSPLNFSDALMESASASLDRIKTAVFNLSHLAKSAEEKEYTKQDNEFKETLSSLKNDFETAMDDDFNTADAISVIFEIVRHSNSYLNADKPLSLINEAKDAITLLCDILGIICETERRSFLLKT